MKNSTIPHFLLSAPWLGMRANGTIITGERQTLTGPEAVEKTRDQIAHRCDGPISATVLIHRALELVELGDANAAAAGEALELELEARGMLRAGFVVTPGS